MTAGAATLLAAATVWTSGSASGTEAATTLTVAKDGSGQYTTVQAAVNAIPAATPRGSSSPSGPAPTGNW